MSQFLNYQVKELGRALALTMQHFVNDNIINTLANNNWKESLKRQTWQDKEFILNRQIWFSMNFANSNQTWEVVPINVMIRADRDDTWLF